jgi:lipid A 3-O-deacylase
MKPVAHKSPLLPLAFWLLAIFTVLTPPPSYAADAAAPAASQPAPPAAAEEARLPDQYGLALDYGYAFDPSPNPTFVMATGFAIYDYGSVWHQSNCPNSLRFKVEGSIGSNVTPSSDLIASVNILAMKYPLGLKGKVRPYGEAGIGVIYTQFRVEGQGLHFNFNPLLGLGLELPRQDGKNIFGAVRLHHISNGGLDHDNRGVNSVVLQVGRVF